MEARSRLAGTRMSSPARRGLTSHQTEASCGTIEVAPAPDEPDGPTNGDGGGTPTDGDGLPIGALAAAGIIAAILLGGS